MFNEMMPMSGGGANIDEIIANLELTSSSAINLSGSVNSSGNWTSSILNASDYGLKYVLGLVNGRISDTMPSAGGMHHIVGISFPDPADKTKFRLSVSIGYSNLSFSLSASVVGYAE